MNRRACQRPGAGPEALLWDEWRKLLPLPSASMGQDSSDVAGGEEAVRAPRESLRVLIIEDEVLTADYLQHLLVELGHTVSGHALNSVAGFKLAQNLRPHLILMDINLGRGGDGVDLAAEILQKLEIPSVFVTAYGDRGTLQRAQAAKPLAILHKPFNREMLQFVMDEARAKLKKTDS